MNNSTNTVLRKQIIFGTIIFLSISAFSQKSDLMIQKINGFSEIQSKKYFDSESLDPIEGIWQTKDGFSLSIEKKLENGKRSSKKYHAVVITTSYKSDFWKTGYIRAIIEKTATANLYYAETFIAGFDAIEIQTGKAQLSGKNNYLSINLPKSDKLIECVKTYPEQENSEILIKDLLGPSYGTGFIITTDGYIVTNLHVVNAAKTIKIYGLNKNFISGYKADVIIADERYDLALLRISDPAYKPLEKIPFAFSFNEMAESDEVFTIGYPGAKNMPEKTACSEGLITAITGVHGDLSTYRTSVELIPGNSGGPLFNSDGNIVGIVKSVFVDAENVGFAVKIASLKKMIDLLAKKPNIPLKNTIKHLSLHEKQKVLGEYTCIIEVNGYFDVYNTKSTMKILSAPESESSETDEADPDTYYSIAMFQLQSKEYEASYNSINKAINNGLSVNYAYFLRGYLGAYLKKNAVLVINDINTYMKHDTSNAANLYLYRGETYEMLGINDSAIMDYSNCIEKDSTVLEAWMRRGLLKNKLEIYADAVIDFGHILNQFKNSETKALAKIYFYKGENLMKLGLYNEALENLNHSLDIDISDLEAWTTRGQIYFHLKKYDDCIKDMNKAISIEETEISYFWRGKAQICSGKNTEGNRDIEKSKMLASNANEKK